MGVLVAGVPGRAGLHHGSGRRVLTLHHVSHARGVWAGVAGGSRPVGLVDHGLDDSPPGVDEPVVDLEDGQTRVLGQLLLLILGGVRVLKYKTQTTFIGCFVIYLLTYM